jgi:sulfatase maturation enzyme AslB (radical SAM superfamily)
MKYLKEAINQGEMNDITNTMFITLMVTEHCNFQCEYCDVVDFQKVHRFIEWSDLLKTLDFIDFQHPRPNIVFRFFGGEPMLHPQFVEMCHEVKNHFEGRRNLDILLTTNLSKSYTECERIPDFMTVVPSLHTDWVVNCDDWFTKVLRLHTRGMLHHALLMLKDDNHEIIKDLYTRYHATVPIVVVPIDEYMHTEEYKQFKLDFPCELDDSEYEAFIGKEDMVGDSLMCSSGVFIDEDGYLFDCWVKQTRKANIFENPLSKSPQFHLCQNYCDDCDMEVVRCSLKHYLQNFCIPKKEEFTKEELELYNREKVLFRCNG